MKISVFLLFLLLISCNKDNVTVVPIAEPFIIKGVDVSFLPEIEAENTVFYNKNGEAENALTILKNAGCNTIRIRLWHRPSSEHSGFKEVKTFAKRVKAEGLKVWLTVHYSDSWADPAKQFLPTAWENLDFSTLNDSVANYTERIMTEIKPDYIQIGNEINHGFMWEIGRPNNQFYELLKRASKAVRATNSTTKIILHYAGFENSTYFFNEIRNNAVDYDWIGLSYYPNWHGKNLIDLENKMNDLKADFDKRVLIAETAYPFTLAWNDWTNNIIGLETQLLPNYPATPKGQKDFLLKIKEISTKNGNLGFCYWAGTWLAFRGEQSTEGSTWENQALFDFENKALPVLEAFLND